MKKQLAAIGGFAAAGLLATSLVAGAGLVAAQTPPTQTPRAQQQQNRGWLGATLSEANNQVTIRSVVADGPAAKAGLQANDRIVSINGQNVTSIQQVQGILNPLQPNTQVQLVVNRNNANQNVTVTLGAAPTGQGRDPRGEHGGMPGLPFAPGARVPFDNQRGGSFSYVDDQGRAQTIVIAMGKVTSVDAANSRVTVEKNGGGSQVYRVDTNTRLRGTLADLSAGTQVVVTTNQATPDLALSIHGGGAKMSGRPANGAGPGGRGGQRTPRGAAPSATPNTNR
ncbi:MAG: PDZ domain-containing protein [Dehalococcoidia bacterium]